MVCSNDPSPPAGGPPGERLERRTLLSLLDASRAINDELEPADACQLVSERACSVLASEGASVLLHDVARDDLVFLSVVDAAVGDIVRGLRFPADQGIAGQVLRTGRSVRLDDVRGNRHFYPGIDELTKTRTRSLMAAPLVHAGTVFGVLEIVNHRGSGAFAADDLDLLSLFANLVAGAAWKAQTLDRLLRDNRALRQSLPRAELIGRSEAFEHAAALCRRVAPTPTTVLLQGETGTGKEMAARAIWGWSSRADRPFVAVNCAALPESLIESELFGHEAGAFTGAVHAQAGRFQQADGGTLLLDEIGELDLAVQSKLLRVLESGECTPVGAAAPTVCDVRVIAATNRDLKAEVDAGRFRSDLYYRIGAFPITLPPLRERLDDLPLLVEHLVTAAAATIGTARPAVSDEALACLRRYRWPGNIRELRNVIERAVLLSEGEVTPAHLPREIVAPGAPCPALPSAAARPEDMPALLAEQEQRLVLEALERHGWNQSAAARELGVTRDVLRYRMKRYGLKRS